MSDAGRRHAQQAVEGLESRALVLDVGGGPGGHAGLWADLGHRAVVLDPGRAMLDTVRHRRGVAAVRGTAQQMPFRAGVFRLVYFHLSIHYGDWRTALDEARRVADRGGRIRVWTLGPDHHRASMLARWFPSVDALDRERFPDPADLAEHLSGDAEVSVGWETAVQRRRAGEWAAAVEAGFVSTLQLVPPAELDSGLRAFREQYPDPDDVVEYEMRWTWLVADV